MARDPRFDILFEPVQIGPVTSKNRFYQVPHCNGMGYGLPMGLAAMRGVKAEGGWGVVCTEEVEIHPTSDVTPAFEGRLWDDSDIPALALMTEAVHAHGSLAGLELVHNGHHSPNRYSRVPPIAPSAMAVDTYDPVQARAMDKADIRAFRQWHRDAALRGKQAGFDIIYVYAGHNLCLPMHFIAKRYNDRTDEYGGSLENRVRLFRELIEDTKEAVGNSCAVAVRFAVDELLGPDGITAQDEGREVVEMLAEMPDLWDVNVSDWSNDSLTSRFGEEGNQESYVGFVKSLTSKPVVGVGRFTSPDAMVSQIRRGVLDMIGAARPSIADPFLPKKLEEGRIEEIRECIGCNICVSGDMQCVPIRCTQNPTMGEEWRRGWHPEKIAPKGSDDSVLVVGAGPAGLECSLALAKRGYEVTLAEAGAELGGRVTCESQLPGLSQWARVRDYRVGRLQEMANVSIYRESPLSAPDVRDFGFARVIIATGASWRRDGLGRALRAPLPGLDQTTVYTRDDLMAGGVVGDHLVVYDDDHYYMGGVLAEKLIAEGHRVTLVTPAAMASAWTENTLEQHHIQSRLLSLGVEIIVSHRLSGLEKGAARVTCVYSERDKAIACDGVVLVTERLPKDGLYRELADNPDGLTQAGITSLRAIGDCYAPATVAAAVYGGHLAARELDDPSPEPVPFLREPRRL